MNVYDEIQKYWKAIAGALAPAAVLIVAGLTEQSDGGGTITQSEWITALAAVVITGGAVLAAPSNKTGKPDVVEPAAPQERPDPPYIPNSEASRTFPTDPTA